MSAHAVGQWRADDHRRRDARGLRWHQSTMERSQVFVPLSMAARMRPTGRAWTASISQRPLAVRLRQAQARPHPRTGTGHPERAIHRADARRRIPGSCAAASAASETARHSRRGGLPLATARAGRTQMRAHAGDSQHLRAALRGHRIRAGHRLCERRQPAAGPRSTDRATEMPSACRWEHPQAV